MKKRVRESLSAVLCASFLFTGLALPKTVSADSGVGTLPAAGVQVQLYLRSDGGSTDATGPLSFSPGAGLAADTIQSANGSNYDGSPKNATTYVLSGLSAVYDGSLDTKLQAYLNSPTAGNGTQIQLWYDFDGDGTADALQCYDYLATDGSPSSWELYPTASMHTYGTMSDFKNGTLKVQVWNAIGGGSSQIATDSTSANQSYVKIPYHFTSYTQPSAPTPGAVTPAAKAPLPIPDAYPSQAVGSDWQTALGAAGLSSNPQPNYVGGDGYLHVTTPPSAIHKTANLTGATPTNSWESSIVFQNNGYQPLYTLPLATKWNNSGLGVEMPTLSYYKDAAGDLDVMRQYDDNSIDLTVGADSFVPAGVNADKITDWSADILMSNADGSKSMKATLTEGSPYLYFIYNQANPQITFSSVPTVISGGAGSQYLEIRTNGQYYGLFAPAGSTWSGLGTTAFTCNLPSGKNYFSVALLPGASADLFQYYAAHAYAFVTDTEVRWRYNQTDSTVETTYLLSTTAKEGTNTDTITALIPSQWKNNAYISTLAFTYDSIRGTMKTTCGTMFQTKLQYNGILPSFPDTALQNTSVKTNMQSYLNELTSQTPLISGDANNGDDTYFQGKGLEKIANALPVAEQLGDTAAAAQFTQAMKSKINDFFTYSGGSDKSYFYYDADWGTLIGYPASFGSDNELNDHYFHYGYFIYAAGQLALRDPSWASQYGPMVKLLISDIANPDKTDTRFPVLRNYDPYQGHSWASGDDPFAAGNNQESSSEAINAWAGIILFGEATGDTSLRDLGIYLYTNEINDVNTYNFNLYGGSFDVKYTHVDASQIWGAKYNQHTWWTDDPIEEHGINLLPITTASFYLGASKDFVKKNYDATYTEFAAYKSRGGTADQSLWQDVMSEYDAFYDPAAALNKWNDTLAPEGGESKVHTYDYLTSLNALGTPDLSVSADTPLYSVFNKDGAKTYVAYNTSGAAVTVTFSDGAMLSVPAHTLASSAGSKNPTVQTAAAPAFAPGAGTYTSAQSVTISTATAGATIYYTTDGSTPDTSSTVYTGPVTVERSETLKAIAVKSGMNNSGVAVAAYTINTGGGSSTYTIGSFTARLALNGTTLTVTLQPSGTGDTASNLWYTNLSNPTQLSQAIAGYSTGSKNADGSYVITIPNVQLGANGLIDLYLATNQGDTGWVSMSAR